MQTTVGLPPKSSGGAPPRILGRSPGQIGTPGPARPGLSRFRPPAPGQPPSAAAVLVLTAAADALVAPGAFASVAAYAAVEQAGVPTMSATFTAPAILSGAGGDGVFAGAGNSAGTPALTGLEAHDAMVAAGTFATSASAAITNRDDDRAFVAVSGAIASMTFTATADSFGGVGSSVGGVVPPEFTFDPYAAQLLGSSTRLTPYPIFSSARTIIAIQANGQASGAAFRSDDILTAAFYPYGYGVSVFSPAVSWFTAADTQTGYEQAQFAVTVAATQAALLQPSIRYVLDVFRASSAAPSTVDLVATFTFVAKSTWQP